MDTNEFFEHHGVKGMHWGIRNKTKNSVKVARKPSSDHKKAHELKKKKAHELTNAQLKVLNERLNLEQNYARLNPASKSKGKTAANAILKNSNKILVGAITGVATQQVATLLKKKLTVA